MIDQSHVRAKDGEQDAAFTIEVIDVEQSEEANVESMINVESYFAAIASSYISKVYGVKNGTRFTKHFGKNQRDS
jgi:hypothetical protein